MRREKKLRLRGCMNQVEQKFRNASVKTRIEFIQHYRLFVLHDVNHAQKDAEQSFCSTGFFIHIKRNIWSDFMVSQKSYHFLIYDTSWRSEGISWIGYGHGNRFDLLCHIADVTVALLQGGKNKSFIRIKIQLARLKKRFLSLVFRATSLGLARTLSANLYSEPSLSKTRARRSFG